MTVAEPRRNHLYELVKENLDEEAAETLFDMLDSNNPNAVATKDDVRAVKDDLHAFRAEWKEEVHALRTELHAFRAERKEDVHALRTELHAFRAEFKDDLNTMQARYITWLLATQGVVVAMIGVATSVLIAVLR